MKTMDYEKKYKDALSWIKDVYPTFKGAVKEDAEHYFPELRESEDERIREWLIRLISTNGYRELESDPMPCNRMDILSWLERQGQKPQWNPSDEQMGALYNLMKYAVSLSAWGELENKIESLYKDLKKLREG